MVIQNSNFQIFCYFLNILVAIYSYKKNKLTKFATILAFIIGLITFLGLTSFPYYVSFIFSYLSKKVSLSFSFL